MIIRIATRKSPLAMWQAEHVADLLRASVPGAEIEFVSLHTHADQTLHVPIAELGGKGAFSKEVQERVFSGAADIAVHSAKDLQAITPDGLVIAAIPERGNPCDALVGSRLDDLSEGALVATGSNRRRVQLQSLRPDLRFEGLRGNINTRLSKAGDYDAIVMAAAALERLGEAPPIVDVLSAETFIPQVGQGALAVECRADDATLIEVLAGIDHSPSRRTVEAERGFLVELGGDCDLPAGAHAVLSDDGVITLQGVLASEDETMVVRGEVSSGEVDSGASGGGPLAEADLGAALASSLRAAIEESASS